MTIIRVIDFETTGEGPEAQVCEAGYADLHLEEARVDESVSWLCGVDAIPPEARAVHHIRPQDCRHLPPFDPASLDADEVDAFAAHNAAFELQFVPLPKPVICTWKAALRVWPEAPSHGNGPLRYWLEDRGRIAINFEQAMPAHRAGPDAYVTAHILLALFQSGRTGREMARWTLEPAALPRCPIGKFRGRPWEDVETGFLQWMLKTPDMDEDLKWNARRELDSRTA
jgi:exodeoxyribonuclease X